MSAFTCADFRDRAPELALGLIGGDQRGAAIEHLASCSACRIHLEEMMRVADLLLRLAPPVEPDVGFEARVIARLAAEGAFAAAPSAEPVAAAPEPPGGQATIANLRREERLRVRAARRWALPLAAAAAVIVVAVAGLVGLAAGRDSGRTSGLQSQAAAVNKLAARAVVVRADGGRSECQLVAFPAEASQPARVVIHLYEPGDSPDSSYQVFVDPTDGGPAVAVGAIVMSGGQGTLIASVPAGTGPVHRVRIIEAPNSIKYSASFASV